MNKSSQNWPAVAYFSMEIAIDPEIPTYSGGLGVLAGDTLRAAADVGIPLVAVTLLHRKGYFRQWLDAEGNQTEEDSVWNPETHLKELGARVQIEIEDRRVSIRAWEYQVHGINGHDISVLLLDTDLEENDEKDRGITQHLYGGDSEDRFRQEMVLGYGGIELLRTLYFNYIKTFHMNEGHSAFLCMALLEKEMESSVKPLTVEKAKEEIFKHCVFTTHTPVPAGHDQFPIEMANKIMGKRRSSLLHKTSVCLDGTLNMTYLALAFSRFVNGVAMRHGQVSQEMFPSHQISSITNAVHCTTWVSPPFQELFDEFIPEWRRENLNLRYAIGIPRARILKAHLEAKKDLIEEIKNRTGVELSEEKFILGFARRATPYKRTDLIFSDLNRLREIAKKTGGLQILIAGKAHPHDDGGKEMIKRIFRARKELKGDVEVVYLENYNWGLAKFLISGVDLWLNTPKRPLEASGTSGMKAAMNGVPSFSVLDGWWIEGHVEDITGWKIGTGRQTEGEEVEIEGLYTSLAEKILPLYYKDREEYAMVMRWCIALNGSFFNGQRMVWQYLESAYELPIRRSGAICEPEAAWK